MARLSRAQLEAKIDRLTDDLTLSQEKVDRLEGVDRANRELRQNNGELTRELATAQAQRDQVLPLVVSATVCLSPVFGELKFNGVTDDIRGVLLEAADGLAQVTLTPSNRALTLVDPENNVDPIVVDIDQHGKLSRKELRDIRAFRGEVLLARQVSSGRGLNELDLLASPNGAAHEVAAALATKS